MQSHCELSYKKFCSIIEGRKLFESIDNFLVLFSCGKDCTMLLDLLCRYCEEHNIKNKIEVYSSIFPKHMYFDENEKLSDEFINIYNYWTQRGVKFIYNIPNYDDFEDNDKNGCKICKKGRKSVIDNFVNSISPNMGILTGFTMNDALAYINMLLLSCNFNLNNMKDMSIDKRNSLTKSLHKMSLKEKLPNNKIMIRPLLPFNESEVQLYLKIKKIPYLTKSCKISKFKFKREYSSALEVYNDYNVTYEGIEQFLAMYGIHLNDGTLSFDDVKNDNFFIDC